MIHIERGMILSGHLTVVGAMVLDGRFEGSISCPRLEIGPDGYMIGDVVVDELVVEGQIVGNVQARKVDLRSTALVEGDVRHEILSLDPAAILVGDSIRLNHSEMPEDFRSLEARRVAEDEELRLMEKATMMQLTLQAGDAASAYDVLRARRATEKAYA